MSAPGTPGSVDVRTIPHLERGKSSTYFEVKGIRRLFEVSVLSFLVANKKEFVEQLYLQKPENPVDCMIEHMEKKIAQENAQKK